MNLEFILKSDTRRFAIGFIAFTSVMLGGIVATNYLVNPLNYYQTDFFEPMVQTAREEKVARLNQMTAPPDGLILGSSRVLKFEPQYLSERTGRHFYNAGVTHAHAEDHVAILRFFHQRFGQWPKIIILGIDEYAFSDGEPTNVDLICSPQLVAEIPDFISSADRLRPVKGLIEWQQTKLSLQSIKRYLKSSPNTDKIESLCEDGKIVYHRREREIAEGNYDFEAALDYNIQEYKNIFEKYSSLSQARTTLLRNTLEQCHQAGSEIVLFYTPLHPRLRSALEENPKFAPRLSELRIAIEPLAKKANIGICDFSQIASFGGDPSCFVDGIHPLEPNTRRMVDTILNSRNRSIGLAIQ